MMFRLKPDIALQLRTYLDMVLIGNGSVLTLEICLMHQCIKKFLTLKERSG